MWIQMVKSKLHRVKVTQAELHYIGSITIDKRLMEAAGLMAYERVQVVNINNGERLETYVIEGEADSGIICLNGPAARKAQVGDLVIVIGYGFYTPEEAAHHHPLTVFPDDNNRLIVG
ncbi:MAG: aspartate 1-decarboxylase [Bacteroidia bacterium]|jgi:aspartate 1-decarboxylase|nr:aspartate 1-decarboxylase [Bacteroidota bacterium]